ncbi:zinc finger protein [Plasmodium gonderi]|uniref:Zinc finger protein n=1 Tax=Plasmodium gonderi TaxID=77519 RepID=A0A1Y1JH49_PLAGO|nr:zinc finger protein [Plasmodium gonderi]GAW80665.1 zinc finger protein [Plasmodium gonderi]
MNNTFANNAGNYRNRTLNASPKCQNISYKINSIENGASIFCTFCNIPFNSKMRLNPCYHIICSKCYELCAQQQICVICNSEINDVEFLFINENIFVCPFNDCKKGFLNFKSFNYHIHFKHDFLKEKSYNIGAGTTNHDVGDGGDGSNSNSSRISSNISNSNKIKPDSYSIPTSELISTSFFQNPDATSKYSVNRLDDQEYTQDTDKRDSSDVMGSVSPMGSNLVHGNIGSVSDVAPGREKSFGIYNLDVKNFSIDTKNLTLQNMIHCGSVNIGSNNISNGKTTNAGQFSEKWNYTNVVVPFKSDFNSFNFPLTDEQSPPTNNLGDPSVKGNPEEEKEEEEEGDYDNLEDLM